MLLLHLFRGRRRTTSPLTVDKVLFHLLHVLARPSKLELFVTMFLALIFYADLRQA